MRTVPYVHMNSKYEQWTRLLKYHIFIGMLKTYYLDIIISTLEDLPEQQELEGAFDGLFLLHETYNLYFHIIETTIIAYITTQI